MWVDTSKSLTITGTLCFFLKINLHNFSIPYKSDPKFNMYLTYGYNGLGGIRVGIKMIKS